MNNSWSAYQASCRNGWLDEIGEHLIGSKRNYCSNKENCKNEALKYDNLANFTKNAPGAYKVSWKNGWLDEVTSHMIKFGSKYKRCIYCYEFNDNSIYVGLTYNLEQRNLQHLSDTRSKVFIHIKNTGLIPNLIKLTDYINVDYAQKMEYFYLNKYKNDGYNILNKAKTGGVGSSDVKWTKEICKNEALKYKMISEFKNGCFGAYNKCSTEKWYDIIEHLEKRVSWTYDKCKEEALKYKSRGEFYKINGSAYSSALRNK